MERNFAEEIFWNNVEEGVSNLHDDLDADFLFKNIHGTFKYTKS